MGKCVSLRSPHFNIHGIQNYSGPVPYTWSGTERLETSSVSQGMYHRFISTWHDWNSSTLPSCK